MAFLLVASEELAMINLVLLRFRLLDWIGKQGNFGKAIMLWIFFQEAISRLIGDSDIELG